jgi:hypothetical protein
MCVINFGVVLWIVFGRMELLRVLKSVLESE